MTALYPGAALPTPPAGRLAGIAWRPARHAPLVAVASAPVTRAAGVATDARGRPGPRQVTVLAAEDWAAATAAAGTGLPWTARRANLLVSGIALRDSTGAELHIGATLRLVVTGETDPCRRMEAAAPGLRAALEPGWRGGVTCRVVADGVVAVGDAVRLVRPAG
jgi:MOSC domain-containing protein YiiM